MKRARRVGGGLIVLAFIGLGCSFQPDLPSGADIACSAQSTACPAGFTCRPAIGRCLPLTELAAAPVAITNAQVQPSRGNLSTTFVATFSVTAELATPPAAIATAFDVVDGGGQLESFPFACGPCSPSALCQCSFQANPAQPPPQGALQVAIQVTDVRGNQPPPESAGAILFDTMPPGIAAQPPVTLDFTPGPGVTTPVSALGAGGTAELCFSVDKALGASPTVWAADGAHLQQDAGELEWALESGYPLGFRYCYLLGSQADAGLPDGPQTVLADLTDQAGNFARAVLLDADADAGLLLESTPPPDPGMGEDGGLRYRRAPWGEYPTIGTPAFSLSSSGAVFAKPGYLLVYEDAAAQREILRLPVSAGPLAAVALLPPDREQIYVLLVDQAGNRNPSGPLAVLSVDWVASLGLKLANDVTANPNRCFARVVQGPALFQSDDVSQEEDGATGPVGAGSVVTVGGGLWRLRESVADDSTCTRFTDCDSQSFAYDSTLGLLYGYFTGDNETWLFDGFDWKLPAGLNEPANRDETAMTYDAATGQVLLFGGDYLGLNALCDTWAFDGASWFEFSDCQVALTDGGAPPNIPPARYSPMMAYDPQRQRVLLVGGGTDNGSPFFSDTHNWQWDGQTWSVLPDAPGQTLAPTLGGTMVFWPGADGGLGQLVLVGGQTAGPGGGQALTNATWVGQWNGATYAWTALFGGATCGDSAQPPCGNLEIAAAPDSHLLALAAEPPAGGSVHLWTWDGISPGGWSDTGAVPEAVTVSAFFALPRRVSGTGEPIPFGLYGSEADGDRTEWLCPTASAASCAPLHHGGAAPPPRTLPAAAADDQGDLLIQGGSQSITPLDDTWLWDGRDWSNLSAGAGPGLRAAPSLAYLPPAGSFWLYGGISDGGDDSINDLWSFSLDGGWARRSNGVLTTPHANGQLVYVPDAGKGGGLVLAAFAGTDSPELVVSSAGTPERTALVSSFPAGVTPDIYTQPAYDLGRSRLVLFDDSVIGELEPGAFAWRWFPYDGVSNPSCVVYDAAAGATLIIGSGPGLGQTIESTWDGQSATALKVGDPLGEGAPNVFSVQPCAFDAPLASTLMFGGSPPPTEGISAGSTAMPSPLWQFSLANERPAQVCRFDFAASGASATAQVSAIRLLAVAGSEIGSSSVTTSPGASLELWSAGQWTEVARCESDGGACDLATPTPMTATITGADRLSEALQDEQLVGVAVVPSAPNGTGIAQVGVQTLQTVVSYRLPAP